MRKYVIRYLASAKPVTVEKFEQWLPQVLRVVECHDTDSGEIVTESAAIEWFGTLRWSEVKSLSDAVYKAQQLTRQGK